MATLERGQRVEVCPYSDNIAFHYLAHLDGEIGQVQSLKDHGEDLKVSVKFADSLEIVDLPYKALKPVKGA